MIQDHTHSPGNPLMAWIPIMVVTMVALAYLFAMVGQKPEKGSWNRWRSISFISGMGLLVVALWPSMMQWAYADLRGHMMQHLLIGMFAPLFLVLGAPVTLALRTLPVKISRNITAILRSNAFRFLSHPITALLLNIGGMYVLYLTPLYKQSLVNPYLHHMIHLHFLAAGYLFTWSMVGPDPAPKRPVLGVRLGVLFISIAAHAFLSKWMYAYLFPLNVPHSDEQIRQAAKLMYYGGDLSELLLIIALFTVWYQKRGRPHYDLFPLISYGQSCKNRKDSSA